MKKSKVSRQGRMRDGWIKQGLQVPDRSAEDFRQIADQFGAGGVKIAGTVAVEIANSMPAEVLNELAGLVHRSTWPDPKALQPGQVWERFRQLMRERDESGEAPAPLPLARAT